VPGTGARPSFYTLKPDTSHPTQPAGKRKLCIWDNVTCCDAMTNVRGGLYLVKRDPKITCQNGRKNRFGENKVAIT